jgi:hypothetical protein
VAHDNADRAVGKLLVAVTPGGQLLLRASRVSYRIIDDNMRVERPDAQNDKTATASKAASQIRAQVKESMNEGPFENICSATKQPQALSKMLAAQPHLNVGVLVLAADEALEAGDSVLEVHDKLEHSCEQRHALERAELEEADRTSQQSSITNSILTFIWADSPSTRCLSLNDTTDLKTREIMEKEHFFSPRFAGKEEGQRRTRNLRGLALGVVVQKHVNTATARRGDQRGLVSQIKSNDCHRNCVLVRARCAQRRGNSRGKQATCFEQKQRSFSTREGLRHKALAHSQTQKNKHQGNLLHVVQVGGAQMDAPQLGNDEKKNPTVAQQTSLVNKPSNGNCQKTDSHALEASSAPHAASVSLWRAFKKIRKTKNSVQSFGGSSTRSRGMRR